MHQEFLVLAIEFVFELARWNRVKGWGWRKYDLWILKEEKKIYVSVWLISEIKVFVREILLSNFGM